MWLITGSTAQYHWFSDSRKPKDIDILTPAKFSISGIKECFVDSQWHDLAEHIISINHDKVFVDADILLTLKLSHAHWDIFFDKTMFDIDFLLSKGCNVNYDLYEKLFVMWESIHGKKKAYLNMPNEEFFTEQVVRTYDHDWLHEQVAFNDRPMHERIRPDLTKPMCSSSMWGALTPTEQLQAALEEMMVVAIERKNLNSSSSTIDVLRAVKYAHKHLIVSMTKGWFARYLILNNRNLLSDRKLLWLSQIKNVLQHLD